MIDFIGKSVNFLILFGGLAFLLAKPIRNFLEKRTFDIKKTLEEAEQTRKAAERRQEEVRVRLTGLEEELKKIQKEAEAEGLKEKEKILALARQEAERVKTLAEQEIDLQVKAGIRELKEQAAELATVLAKERIMKKLTPELHNRLIDKSIERLEKLYEKSDLG